MPIHAKPNGGMPVCQNIGDLAQCIATPAHAVPTVEFTVYNLELPLSQPDYNFFTQPEINVFASSATQQTATNLAPARATSENLTDMTLTFDVPFVMMGLCVYAYAEPFDLSVPGNCFGPRAAVSGGGAIANSPLSTDSFVADDVSLAQMFGVAAGVPVAAGITPATCLPATLEWGGPLKGLRLRAGSAITFGDSTTMTSAMGSITIPGSNGQVILSDGAGGVSAANQISIAANAVQIQGHAVVAPTTAGYGQFLQYVSGGWAVATPEPGTNALAIQGIHEQRHGSGV